MKIMVDIDLEEHGLTYTEMVKEAWPILSEVYGKLFIEACYDAKNEHTQEFARPLFEKMSAVNKLLRFKP